MRSHRGYIPWAVKSTMPAGRVSVDEDPTEAQEGSIRLESLAARGVPDQEGAATPSDDQVSTITRTHIGSPLFRQSQRTWH